VTIHSGALPLSMIQPGAGIVSQTPPSLELQDGSPFLALPQKHPMLVPISSPRWYSWEATSDPSFFSLCFPVLKLGRRTNWNDGFFMNKRQET